MSVWSISAAAVLAGVIAGVGHQAVQAPPAPAVTVVAQAVPRIAQDDDQQKVSISFDHAAVSDVMDWLSKNGVSFVADDSDLPKDETITLNVKDQPIGDVLDAIASALGGHWETRGTMRVFRKGEGFTVFGDDGGVLAPSAKGSWSDAPNVKVWSDDGPQTFVMPQLPDMKDFHMPDMAKLRAQLKDLPGMNAAAQKEMEDAMRQAQDEMSKNEELKSLKGMQGINAQTRKEVEEAMREAREQMSQSGDAMKASREAMEEARKAIEEARKEHPEAFNGRMFISPDENGNFKFAPGGNGKVFQYRFGNGDSIVRPRSFTKFVDSLSSAQKEKNRRQGFLRVHDLSEAQRKMLRISGNEKSWSIKIDKDGEVVTVKSDR